MLSDYIRKKGSTSRAAPAPAVPAPKTVGPDEKPTKSEAQVGDTMTVNGFTYQWTGKVWVRIPDQPVKGRQ